MTPAPTIRLALLAACLVLASCGVDGPPMPPAEPEPAPASGVTVSGDAYIGIRANDL